MKKYAVEEIMRTDSKIGLRCNIHNYDTSGRMCLNCGYIKQKVKNGTK